MFNSLSFHEKDNISFTFVRLTRTGSFQVQSLISTNSTHLAHLRFVFQIYAFAWFAETCKLIELNKNLRQLARGHDSENDTTHICM